MKRFLSSLPFLLLIFACKPEHTNTTTTEAEQTLPNIIFIMSDDHAKRAVSSYGSDLISTPNIDKIANNGVLFNNAFVTNSICGPSRAVFLTGKFSHINGFMANQDTFNGDQATLPKYLQQAGYYTSVMGKWHLKSTPQGFDEYSILLDQGEYYNPQFYDGTDTTIADGYSTTVITDKAISVLEKQKEHNKPVFLMVHHKAPHRNWMPDTTHLVNGEEKIYPIPESFYDNYEGRSAAATEQDMRVDDMFLGMDLKLFLENGMEDETGTGGNSTAPSYQWWLRDYNRMNDAQKAAWDSYYEPIIEEFFATEKTGNDLLEWKFQRYMNDYLKSIQSVDDNIGRVLNYLEENNMTENTLVIYTSDQGFFLGEHGWYDKRFMYEPSLSMPLVMQFPNKIEKGKKVDKLVQNLDLAPTILTAAGLSVPADMQGKPLQNTWENNADEQWREKIYYHYYQNGSWHFVNKHLGIRTDRYKLIYFYDLDAWELYDLQEDPEETDNLYNTEKYEALGDSLKQELNELIVQYDDQTAVEIQ